MSELRRRLAGAAILLAAAGAPALAEEVRVTMHRTAQIDVGPAIGVVTMVDSAYGLLVTPDLRDLAPGIHGFHVHQKGDCRSAHGDGDRLVPGLAAGGHFDPEATGSHEGPYGDGHLGDLPVLIVDQDGTATLPVMAPRLKVADIRGRSLMIHAGGDNYSDSPKALGGGGARAACGVIPAAR